MQQSDGPFDSHLSYDCSKDVIIEQRHTILCSCENIKQCVVIFRRCHMHSKVYHSMLYSRRQRSVSYFVQYRNEHMVLKYGKIILFFTCKNQHFAIIEHHRTLTAFSEQLKSSQYYNLLKNVVDLFFSRVEIHSFDCICIPISFISKHCVVFEADRCFIVTPVSDCEEHD